MNARIVLKIQKPLPGAPRPDIWLVTDAHGHIFARIDQDAFPEVVITALAEVPKIYVWGDYRARDNHFTYFGPAPHQPW